jgi:hypothetical protein
MLKGTEAQARCFHRAACWVDLKTRSETGLGDEDAKVASKRTRGRSGGGNTVEGGRDRKPYGRPKRERRKGRKEAMTFLGSARKISEARGNHASAGLRVGNFPESVPGRLTPRRADFLVRALSLDWNRPVLVVV